MAKQSDPLRHKHYTIERNHRLTAGTFGVVYMGINALTGQNICAKHIFHGSIEFSQKEIDNMKRAGEHPNIVEIYDSFVHDGSWIIMEFCPGTSLDVHMATHNPGMSERLQIINQTTSAVQHMHTLDPPMAHRDLKPENIIVAPGPHVKVCDFGLAKSIETMGPVNASTFAGTVIYIAPELWQGLQGAVGYDALKSDMFSLGLVFLGTLTCGKNGNMADFFTPESGEAIGLNLTKQPAVNLLRKRIFKFRHPSPHVKRLVTFIGQMVVINPEDRYDVMQTLEEVKDVLNNFNADHASGGTETPDGGEKINQDAGTPRTAQEEEQQDVKPQVEPQEGIEKATPTPTKASPKKKEVKSARTGHIDWKTAKLTFDAATDLPPGSSSLVAFDQNGCGVVTDENHIYMYRYRSSRSSPSASSSSAAAAAAAVRSSSQTSHILASRIPLPHGMDRYSYKAITDTTFALQKGEDQPTFQFCSSDLHQLETLRHSGRLRGALGAALVYVKGRAVKDYIITVRGRGGDEMVLAPPAGRTWDWGLSVCMAGRLIAVVERETQCLDVFSEYGKHTSYRKLDYKPRFYCGISVCGPNQVIVTEWNKPSLRIHQLPGGETIRVIDWRDLGMAKTSCLRIVQYNEPGIIHLVTDSWTTCQIRSYKVA